jgi:hypothetical protein
MAPWDRSYCYPVCPCYISLLLLYLFTLAIFLYSCYISLLLLYFFTLAIFLYSCYSAAHALLASFFLRGLRAPLPLWTTYICPYTLLVSLRIMGVSLFLRLAGFFLLASLPLRVTGISPPHRLRASFSLLRVMGISLSLYGLRAPRRLAHVSPFTGRRRLSLDGLRAPPRVAGISPSTIAGVSASTGCGRLYGLRAPPRVAGVSLSTGCRRLYGLPASLSSLLAVADLPVLQLLRRNLHYSLALLFLS